jgi:peptidoglycan/LPS O-acetylase OafA/YrhL
MHPVNRNFGLDLARTTAITLVLLAHFVKKIDFLGFLGVELFFSLSGFLIGGILWRDLVQPDQVNLKYMFNFWLRRWYRTLPNYYLFLLIMIVFHQYITDDLKSYNAVFASLWFGQNFLARDSNFFSVSWSLCIEEWFYVIFPILLLMGNLIGIKKQKLLLLAAIFLILFSVTIRYLLHSQESVVGLRAITLARLDAIVYGVISAYLSTEVVKEKSLHIISLLLGMIGLFMSMLFLKRTETLHELYLLILAPLSCALILPGLTHLSFSNSIFLPLKKMIENISLWSYSIYLCHIPVLIICYVIMDPFRDSVIGNVISKIIGLFFTFFIASLLFKKFEQPILHLRPKSF